MEDRIKKVKKLGDYATELGISTASLSIAWCLKNPHVTTAILGASKKEQLLDNLKALEIVSLLDTGVMEQIERIMQTKPVILPEY
jgi:aryl-alcohol dehydrogenase-like predicted oxidoreductase